MLLGLNVPTSADAGVDPAVYARLAEDLGYDYVSASDHPCGPSPTLETWTMLTWIAARTSRIRIATRVLGVPYRNVPMVAKLAETLDRLSDGRLILGLGGGHSDQEFREFGIPVPTPRDKIDGLEEAVRIIRGLWSEPEFTFAGRLHQTDRTHLEPKPARRIPVWLGTFGRRGLAVTGRLADGWIPSLSHAAPQDIPRMRDQVLGAAADAGRDPDEITCAYNVALDIRERAQPRPGVVAGPPEAVTDTLLGFRHLGFTSMNFSLAGPDILSQTERLATDVLPALRRGAATMTG
jgi:alkanesulfonate monooxygenase SsuD/methylene tetrahydromethanopterin reductase-like flavin-dependent oxidoreductase (luciferase family)